MLFVSVFTKNVAQNSVISGYVSDIRNGEKIIGVNIYIPALDIGTVTNNFGFYSLTVPSAENVEISFPTLDIKPSPKY